MCITIILLKSSHFSPTIDITVGGGGGQVSSSTLGGSNVTMNLMVALIRHEEETRTGEEDESGFCLYFDYLFLFDW